MKKLLILLLTLSTLVSYAQDFTGKNMQEAERIAQQYNLRIASKGKLTNMNQQGFNLNYSDWCYHWVLLNGEKVIELAFHPSTGVVFLQTTSMQKYIAKNY